jgi:two-component system, OmpR family, osmolarity sensor histidine kinase EnvZ
MPLRRHDSLFTRLLLTQAVLALGFALLFGLLFYAERSSTVATLVAERWAPALRAAAGLPAAAMPTALPPERRDTRPEGAIAAPAVGPRMTALVQALRQQGVPLQEMAVAFGEGHPRLWLHLQPTAAGGSLWVGLPGEQMLPNVPLRLLAALALGSLLLVAASWWFTRRLTRPLQQLQQHMQQAEPARAGAPPAPLAPLGGATPEIAAIAAAFDELLQRYERHESERALLLAGISHDLRSPLARIRMAAELLPDGGDIERRREAIVRNTRLADRLIGSFLDHVRAGELPLDEPVDLAALARDVLARQQRPEGELQLDAPPQLPLARANALLLERVLVNLLDNACSHGRPPVRLQLRCDGSRAEIAVSDAGAGIAPEAQARALQAFARGDPARTQPGLGLGLAIVARVAARLGGSVGFEPLDGRAAVRVRWPV